MNRSRSLRRPSLGFTLMEVLLAMAIGTVVLGALTMAIDFHLHVVERGRHEVEEGQLARALLRRIADDLRSAVRYDPLDVNSLLADSAVGGSMAGAAAAIGGELPEGIGGALDGSNPSGAGGSTGGSGPSSSDAFGGSSGSTGDPETDPNSDLAQSVVPRSTPGLYGNQYQMQVDVSRLPRIEQYQQLMEAGADGAPVDVVSDVKSVSYYVLDGLAEQGTGLVRRELDRAATAWSVQNGGAMELDLYQELMAPEVVALEFQYFDGLDWYSDWDSTVNKGLPVAVEIAVAISKQPFESAEYSGFDLSLPPTGEENYRVYRLLVHLPASRSAEDEAAAEAAAASAASNSSTGGSSLGNASSSGSGGAAP